MSKPLPQNCKFVNEGGESGVSFTLEFQGRQWRAFITEDAVRSLYAADPDILRAVKTHSYVVELIVQTIKSGNDGEPIYLNRMMLDEEGRLLVAPPER